MDGWVWINGGRILTGENWSTGRKTLYSVGGIWMDECGSMVEGYWEGKTEVRGKNIIQRGWYMNGWVWSNGGMILTGENWNARSKVLYIVGGRWMNECGAMVKWYWQGKPEISGENYYTMWVVDGWMSMKQWWNESDRGKLNYWEKTL